MKDGDKGSSKLSQTLRRVSDLIPAGASEPKYPTIKDLVNVDLEILAIKVQYGRNDNVNALIVTVNVKGVENEIKITQRKVVRKLIQIDEHLPLRAKFVKGKRIWDVV